MEEDRAMAKKAVMTSRFADCMTGMKQMAATTKPRIVDFLRPSVSMNTIAETMPGSSEKADNVMSR